MPAKTSTKQDIFSCQSDKVDTMTYAREEDCLTIMLKLASAVQNPCVGISFL